MLSKEKQKAHEPRLQGNMGNFETTVSVTNDVIQNHICPLTPFNVEITYMLMEIGVQKATGRSNIEGRANERNIS